MEVFLLQQFLQSVRHSNLLNIVLLFVIEYLKVSRQDRVTPDLAPSGAILAARGGPISKAVHSDLFLSKVRHRAWTLNLIEILVVRAANRWLLCLKILL